MSLVGRPALNHPQQTGKRGALDKVDDRRTPDSIWQPLNDEFGFMLDVAASHKNAKCPLYFTRSHDGLKRRWFASAWCNPPYSDCGAWVRKANYESRWCDSIVMLLPNNRCEQKWWQESVEPYRRKGILETRFLPGRPRFDVPEGTYGDPRGNRPPFGVCLVIWRIERIVPPGRLSPTERRIAAGGDLERGRRRLRVDALGNPGYDRPQAPSLWVAV